MVALWHPRSAARTPAAARHLPAVLSGFRRSLWWRAWRKRRAPGVRSHRRCLSQLGLARQQPEHGQHPQAPWYLASTRVQNDLDGEGLSPHTNLRVAADRFTAEIWTLAGFASYDGISFLALRSRKSHGPASLCLHRDTKCYPALQQRIEEAGGEHGVFPLRSSHGHSYAACWGSAVKKESRARLTWFGEAALGRAFPAYRVHAHRQRHPRRKGPGLLMPAVSPAREHTGSLQGWARHRTR
jgi:hypothetical protein